MKKILSLILALLMTAGGASAIFADDAVAATATDAAATPATTAAVEEEVPAAAESSYEKRAIDFLWNYKIYKGTSADDLAADDLVERYQMALFVSRISTGWVDDSQWEDGPEDWSGFTDLAGTPAENYYGALSYATTKKIIEGYGNGKFGPVDNVTYQDAITMVVRTLGYTGLDWPWGYIEKASTLGLTDGISGVKYTDYITRGGIAQLLYNALFATTKDGQKLAMQCFGVEFGWEKVLITASNLNSFEKDTDDTKNAGKVATDAESDSYTEYPNSNKKTPDGIIAFKLLKDDGSLGDDTYYMDAKELGLAATNHGHDDEIAVGTPYYIFFEIDGDDNYVKLIEAESLYVDTVENKGKTDDAGKTQSYDIDTLMKDYAIVTKYSSASYVNTTKSLKPEVIISEATGVERLTKDGGSNLAIDWNTGDILVPDGDPDDDGNQKYKIAWHYNKELGLYYEYVYTTVDKVNSKVNFDEADGDDAYYTKPDVIAVNFMTPAELEATYKKYSFKVNTDNYANYYFTPAKVGGSAYASLKLFDTDIDDDQAFDRGLYEEYRLGYFSNSSYDCGKSHTKTASYKLSYVDSAALADKALKAADKNYAGDLKTTGSFEFIVDGTKSACDEADGIVRGWFVTENGKTYAPVSDGNGGYKDGYVIFGVDPETGAIKIVKNIPAITSLTAADDQDTYTGTGVLRAYNVTAGTVNIDGTSYKINDYSALLGNMFNGLTSNIGSKTVYASYLRDCYNQFIEYVVVDGTVVCITRQTANASDIIVVHSYAGMSSDGYIVVNGYLASNPVYRQFKIGSYNSWEKGDYYYFMNEQKAAESFTQGTIYGISSYDKANDAYYVQLIGEYTFSSNRYPQFTSNGMVKYDYSTVKGYNLDTDTKATKITDIEITTSGDGYMTIRQGSKQVPGTNYYKFDSAKVSDETSQKKMSGYKFIILRDPSKTNANQGTDYRFAPLVVVNGTLSNNAYKAKTASVAGTGTKLTGYKVGDNGSTIVLVADWSASEDNDKVIAKKAELGSGLVAFFGDRVMAQGYDVNSVETGKIYIYGASQQTEVIVFNLMTGKAETAVTGTNVSPKSGHVYYTLDGVLVEDLGLLALDDNRAYNHEDNYYKFVDALQYILGDIGNNNSANVYWADYFTIGASYMTYVEKEGYYKCSFLDTDKNANKKAFEQEVLAKTTAGGQKTGVGNLNATHNGAAVNNISYYLVKYASRDKIDEIKSVNAKELNKELKAFAASNTTGPLSTLGAAYVYNYSTGDAVVYILLADKGDAPVGGTTTQQTPGTLSTAKDAISEVDSDNLADAVVTPAVKDDPNNALRDAKLQYQVDYDVTKVNGEITEYKINGIHYFFTVDDAAAAHDRVSAHGYSFGLANTHGDEDYNVSYTITNDGGVMGVTYGEGDDAVKLTEGMSFDEKLVWKSVVETEYKNGSKDCDDCDMVSGIYVKFDKPIVIKVGDETSADIDNHAVEFDQITIKVKIDMIKKNGTTANIFESKIQNAYIWDGKEANAANTGNTTGMQFNSKGTILRADVYADLTSTVHNTVVATPAP